MSIQYSHSVCVCVFANLRNLIIKFQPEFEFVWHSVACAVAKSRQLVTEIPQHVKFQQAPQQREQCGKEGPHARPHAINVTVYSYSTWLPFLSRISQVICSRRLMAAAAVPAVPVPADGIAHSSVHVILPACCLTAPPSPPSACCILSVYKIPALHEHVRLFYGIPHEFQFRAASLSLSLSVQVGGITPMRFEQISA